MRILVLPIPGQKVLGCPTFGKLKRPHRVIYNDALFLKPLVEQFHHVRLNDKTAQAVRCLDK